MGTRADFYIGRGEQAEWLGSIAWDGYPDGIDAAVLKARSAPKFRSAVLAMFDGRDDATRPEDGWPWPWDTSSTTDYAYAFDGGKVWASCFGSKWYRASDPAINDDKVRDEAAVFPNMKDRKAVTVGKRSGLIVIEGP